MTPIAENFSTIKSRIKDRARLIAVSKTQSADAIQAALETGHRLFGENRVQEAKVHWQDVKPRYPDLELHLIGPLQTNKVKEALALFDVIQTLDRESLIDALAREEEKQRKKLKYFIQINTGDEDQKAGVNRAAFPALLAYAKARILDVTGLMCIPPVAEDPAPHFALLKELADQYNLPDLSMGMSEDFETAIAQGANYVRVGTALFGRRP